MKHRYRLICGLLAICMLVSAAPFFAGAAEAATEGTCGKNLTWSLDTETGVLTVSGTGAMTNFEVNNSGSTAPWMNFRNDISKVILEEGVTSVGAYAFSYCYHLKEISFPSTLRTIKNDVFYWCNIKGDLKLPVGLKTIGDRAFYNACSYTETITVPGTVKTIGQEAFYLGDNHENKILDSLTLGEGVETIGTRAFFSFRKLYDVTIPASVTAIGEQAFGYWQHSSTKTLPVDYFIIFGTDGSAAETYARENGFPWNLSKLEAPVCIMEHDRYGNPHLRWEKVPGATAYKIYRAESENGPYKLRKTTAGSGYVNSSVEDGKTYYYKMKAIRPELDMVGDFSEILSGKRVMPNPRVTGSNVPSTGKVKLTWEPVEGADRYKIYRAFSFRGTYKLMLTTENTHYTNTCGVAGRKYYYVVQSISDSDPSMNSSASFWHWYSYTCRLPRPVVTASLTASGKPKLTWEPIKDAVQYKVYRSESKSGTYRLMKTVTEGTSYVNTSIESGKRYYYKVRAIHEKGLSAPYTAPNSAFSTVVKVQVP